MQPLLAYSSLAITVTLALTRPRVGRRLRFGPLLAAALGVLILAGGRVIALAEVSYAVRILWRPLLTLAAIMVMASAAENVGVLRWIAGRLATVGGGHSGTTFTCAFAASAAAAAVLNNDSAVILMTPLIVGLVARLYPDRPALVEPFACGVFLAPGVAPFLTSNPMNTIVASYAGLTFNQYAIRMLPISLASILVTYCVLRLVYRKELVAEATPAAVASPPALGGRASVVLGILLAVLLAYPIASYLGGQVWMVALPGAVACVAVARGSGVGARRLSQGVPFEILFFLAGLFLIALGMRNVGAIGQLSGWYRCFLDGRQQLGIVGVTSLLGSAVVNNHPMAILNMLALQAPGTVNQGPYLAALIGGDLGPRLLPVGSLAGLLWLEALRRNGVHVPLERFVKLGVLTTVPAFTVSILLLLVLA